MQNQTDAWLQAIPVAGQWAIVTTITIVTSKDVWMDMSPTGTQNFTVAKPSCRHHLQAPHCHWEARQLSRVSSSTFAGCRN